MIHVSSDGVNFGQRVLHGVRFVRCADPAEYTFFVCDRPEFQVSHLHEMDRNCDVAQNMLYAWPLLKHTTF